MANSSVYLKSLFNLRTVARKANRLWRRPGSSEVSSTTPSSLAAALVVAVLTLSGCRSVDQATTELTQLKRAQRQELFLACFNGLYDPANPYHNMLGMQRACSKFAKAQLP